MRLILVLLILLSVVESSPAYAETFWHAPGGSDANPCSAIKGDTDPGVYRVSPLSAQGCMDSADDVTIIKAGTYTGSTAKFSTTTPDGSRVEGDPSDSTDCGLLQTCKTIFLPGINTNSVIGGSNKSYAKISFDLTNATKNIFPIFVQQGATNILFEGIEVHHNETATGGSTASGIASDGRASFVTWRKMHVHHIGDTVSHAGHGGYLSAPDSRIEDSSFHDIAGHGVQVYSSLPSPNSTAPRTQMLRTKITAAYGNCLAWEGVDSVIANNEFSGCGSNGIDFVESGGTRTKILKNVIANNNTRDIGATGIGIKNNNSSDLMIQNNVIFGHPLEIASCTNCTISYNACLTTDNCSPSNKLVITALTDIFLSNTDFRLKPGSSAIDAGVAVSGFPYNGLTSDIGRFEAIPDPVATISTNKIVLTFPMSTNVPIQIPSATGVSVNCTASPTACPASPSVSTASRVTNTDTQVEVVISGIAGNACAAGQTWKISYDSATGSWTDRANAVGANQQVFSFTNVTATNLCDGTGPPPSPGTPVIEYHMNEGVGTTLTNTGSLGSGKNGTVANGATWGTGKTGSGVVVNGGTQQVQIPYGVTINPSTQSMTWVVAVNVPSGSQTATRNDMGTSAGTDQRAYFGAINGTWRVARQATSMTANGASNLAVDAGWNHLCARWDSGTDTVTLYKNGVAGTGGATGSYTSFILPTDMMLGISGSGFNPSAPGTYDDPKLFESLEDCAALYAAWNAPPPTPSGTFAQAAIQFQAVYLDSNNNPINLGALNAAKDVTAGGAVAVVKQVHCQNIADCALTSFKLTYRKNGSTTRIQVPNTETSDGIFMLGASNAKDLNRGTTTARLTGSCAVTNGATQLTADQVPSVDLPQDGCVMLRYIVRVGVPTVYPTYFDLDLITESGLALTGGSTAARINVIPLQASGGF